MIRLTLTPLEMACPDQRVLSIQSHVVTGYVGNKSATFPMQVGHFYYYYNLFLLKSEETYK